MRADFQNLKAAKAALRETITARLQSMSDESRKIQSIEILTKLLVHPAYRESRRVSVYLSTAAEVDTLPILEDLFRSGKTCFVPQYLKGQPMRMVRLMSMDDYHSLPMTRWQIKQPKAADEREDALSSGGLDLVVMPGVAFSMKGDRLGHGMGYYDKFLSGLGLPTSGPTTIALAFREQIVDELPTGEHDVTVSHVITSTAT